MFEWRIRGFRRSVARHRGVRRGGRKDFDAPATVAQRSEGAFEAEVAGNPSFAHLMAGRSARLYVKGTWKGRAIDLGTSVVPGRDFDLFVSHAFVETDRPLPSFRVMTRGTLTSLSRLGMATTPTETGDAAFDREWVVDADHAVATKVLDAPLAGPLLELQTRIGWMGVASIESIKSGLIVRWPAEVSASSAADLRDLAIQIADRLAP
ncbi:MAG: hypothetical protein IPJ34_22305 [Myxococcales bacterium]|nr:hypothetical protein [Myxococcales bacterium]